MDAAPWRQSNSVCAGGALLACIASCLVAATSGCCAGRVVSIRLHEDAPSQAPCAFCRGKGCEHCLLARLGGRKHALGGLHSGGRADFRSPAMTPPLPRFHPVPTRPVFEPREGYAPLKLLQPAPAALPGDTGRSEPTPASLPSILKP
jgi:hypothetical protein